MGNLSTRRRLLGVLARHPTAANERRPKAVGTLERTAESLGPEARWRGELSAGGVGWDVLEVWFSFGGEDKSGCSNVGLF